MKMISAFVEINAPASKVWEILADFSKFPDWNPFIRSASGELKVGSRIKAFLKLGSGGITMKPTLLAVEPSKELRWKGSLIIPGLFDGEHSWLIETLPDGRTKLTQSEKFTGLLVPLFAKTLDTDTLAGFQSMNAALKQRAEAAA